MTLFKPNSNGALLTLSLNCNFLVYSSGRPQSLWHSCFTPCDVTFLCRPGLYHCATFGFTLLPSLLPFYRLWGSHISRSWFTQSPLAIYLPCPQRLTRFVCPWGILPPVRPLAYSLCCAWYLWGTGTIIWLIYRTHPPGDTESPLVGISNQYMQNSCTCIPSRVKLQCLKCQKTKKRFLSSERFFLCKKEFDIQKEKNLLMQVRAMLKRRQEGVKQSR